MRWRHLRGLLLVWLQAQALAQPLGLVASSLPGVARPQAPMNHTKPVTQWLQRLHWATQQHAYVGTFEVTSGADTSQARIWHVAQGGQHIERVEVLTGVPRTIFRRNDDVMIYLPNDRVVIAEKRAALGLFPNLPSRADLAIAQHYQLTRWGHESVAGVKADVVQLEPRDAWRFAYRVWTEQATGLVLKLQTLDAQQQVLEQSVFLQWERAQPLDWDKLNAMMNHTEGFLVKQKELISTTADKEGWQLKFSVPGFQTLSCHKRLEQVKGVKNPPLQCVVSDGLASVSLFMEPFEATRHTKYVHERMAWGATHMQSRQVGNWWLTAVGEVPPATLELLVQGLERKN
ncbi:MucB/RseB C-terminal domain-containing protein [Rhodoferax sp.]|uniref:MucB/RseB C-terminal domain-containing protein n=1 Tax=Rhodoferax sp. TaxID=50421 RepID=UPI00260764FB|nr:MucB/RseB C-terminal domain-containing protein [Rhodoferax sp.]MDD2810944.1 MucB/RseB C-terminal domain-containing protein [Rhodoferax sp.]MDD4942455.1 MucB/RseB C-terminal domain-containing protein [Rhodoferax sp.]